MLELQPDATDTLTLVRMRKPIVQSVVASLVLTVLSARAGTEASQLNRQAFANCLKIAAQAGVR